MHQVGVDLLSKFFEGFGGMTIVHLEFRQPQMSKSSAMLENPSQKDESVVGCGIDERGDSEVFIVAEMVGDFCEIFRAGLAE